MVAHEPLHLPMRIEPISDPADPRVADYRDIKDAELRLRRGLFVAASRARGLGLVACPGVGIRLMILTGAVIDSLGAALQAVDAPIYLTSHEVARAVVGSTSTAAASPWASAGSAPSRRSWTDRAPASSSRSRTSR